MESLWVFKLGLNVLLYDTSFVNETIPFRATFFKHSKLALIIPYGFSSNDSIGTLITKKGDKLETQVYRKRTNTGLLLHFQSHTEEVFY